MSLAAPAVRPRRPVAQALLAHVVAPLVAVGLAAGGAGAAPAPSATPAVDRGDAVTVRPGSKGAKKSAKRAKAAGAKASRRKRAATASRARTAKASRAARKASARATRAGRRAAERAERAERTSRRSRHHAERSEAASHSAATSSGDGARAAAAAAARVMIPAVTLATAAPMVGTTTAPAATPVRAVAGPAPLPSPDTVAGRSGKLRARWGLPSAAGLFAYLRRAFGDSAAAGVRHATPAADGVARPFTYIAMLPFGEKVGGRIGGYRMGFWPGESRHAEGVSTVGGRYAPPAGFIQVTAENAATPVSEHFRLRDFLTHDQARVWPKYLALDAALVDKLELVLDDLRARGLRAERLHVMSGFRTPQYNRGGGDPRGRAEQSRHQYGDAADVWVENGAGAMADLNGDGRVDVRDAGVLAESVERVEARHPELVGGVGVYRGTRAHGPFVHVDTRGTRARWGAG